MKTRARISLMALAAIALAVAAIPASHAAATRYITVSAQGTVKVVPDAVRISATVSAVASTSKDALAAANKSATAIRAALKISKD
jgi:uncharacterized protein YggE